MREPLTPSEAKALLVKILEGGGNVAFSDHARREMQADRISQQEAIGVLRAGVAEPAEFENGSWRYRVRRSRVFVVVTFRSQVSTVVVTAWRKKSP